IDSVHAEDFKIVTDFPMNQVSANHVWAKDNALTFKRLTDDTIQWDFSDENVQEKLKETVVNYISEYDLDGIRLSYIEGIETAYLNEVIAAIKDVKPNMYVFSTLPSDANFDLAPNIEKMNILREAFVQFDADVSKLDIFKDK